MSATATATRIDLLTGCAEPHCWQMAGELKAQLDPNYSRGAAIMTLPESGDHWLAAHRTARRRVFRAGRLGYGVGPIDRQRQAAAIHAINTSAEIRQGRLMSAAYLERPTYGPNPQICDCHHVYTIGVYAPRPDGEASVDDPIVAYLWLYRCGELALVSSILGHADHLDNGIMYQLFWFMVAQQSSLGGTCMYNLWDSGTDGLRFFKTRLGFERGDIEWQLA